MIQMSTQAARHCANLTAPYCAAAVVSPFCDACTHDGMLLISQMDFAVILADRTISCIKPFLKAEGTVGAPSQPPGAPQGRRHPCTQQRMDLYLLSAGGDCADERLCRSCFQHITLHAAKKAASYCRRCFMRVVPIFRSVALRTGEQKRSEEVSEPVCEAWSSFFQE